MKDEIPLKAQVLLDPLNKYRIYGVFPWIFFVHILTVILDSFMLIDINNISGNQLRS